MDRHSFVVSDTLLFSVLTYFYRAVHEVLNFEAYVVGRELPLKRLLK